ncbi:MAG: hypothetical protein QG596_1375 [Actinomycetota bacterium]|nr:hypothetical protein [Actinomycetota bacterium]
MSEKDESTPDQAPAEVAPGTMAGANAAGSAPVTHANQLRRDEFRKMMRKISSWVWLLALSIVAGGFFGAMLGPAIGGAVFVVVFLIVLLVIFMIADSRAEDAFYNSYCESHGLTRIDNPSIGGLTPLLRKGDERETDEMFHGELAPGINGDLVLFTYTEVSRDSDGDRQETNYPFTLVHVEMPEIVAHLPELRVQGKFGFKFLEGFEDKFRGDHERVTLESEAMGDRYEIFVRKEQDPVWVRRLFSPSFIVWLTESPPKSFAFEVEDGHLIAFISKHMDDVEGLEEVTRVGTFVAERLLTEVAETSPRTDRETT